MHTMHNFVSYGKATSEKHFGFGWKTNKWLYVLNNSFKLVLPIYKLEYKIFKEGLQFDKIDL